MSMARAVRTVERRARDKRRQRNAIVVPIRKPLPTVKNLDRRIRKINNRQELKHLDVFINAVEMASDPGTSQTVLLNGNAQGQTVITHIGDRTTFTSIQMKAIITFRGSDEAASAWRVLIVRDMQTNGVAPTFGLILDNTIVTNLTIAPYNQDYSERFRILYDRRGTINATTISDFDPSTGTTSTYGVTTKYLNFKKRLNFVTNYGLGTAGTVAEIAKNSVYVLFLASFTQASDDSPLFTMGTRMYYKDD